MPVLDGIAATRQICAAAGDAGPRVLVLTTFDLDEYVYDALQAGASGFLLKDAPPETLFEAVRVVAAGEALLAPVVTRRLIAEFARLRPPQRTRPEDLDALTRARGRDSQPGRSRSFEPRDRRPPRAQQRDGEDARQPRPAQARASRPSTSRGRRVRVRPRRTWSVRQLPATKIGVDSARSLASLQAVLERISVYPVKSLAGVDLEEAEVEPWGLRHDRRWLLLNPDGSVLTAREQHELLAIRADPLDDCSISLTGRDSSTLRVNAPVEGNSCQPRSRGSRAYAAPAPRQTTGSPSSWANPYASAGSTIRAAAPSPKLTAVDRAII